MAEKAKFDREGLRLSLSSEQDARVRMLLLLKKKMRKKNRWTGCSGAYIWIGSIDKALRIGWRWRKERTCQNQSMMLCELELMKYSV